MPPLVSVIIPCYNQGCFLAEAVESALAQNYKPVEIVVVDDGSVDETPEVCARYGDSIVYIRQENRGLPAARNTGIRAASGELIALLDSDDRWLPGKLALQVPAFLDPKVGLVCTAYRAFDTHSGEVLRVSVPPARQSTHDLWKENSVGAPVTAVFRKSLFEVSGAFDESFILGCEDWDFWLRLSPHCDIVGLPDVTAEYREHAGGMSRNNLRMCLGALGMLRKNKAVHGSCRECRTLVQRKRASLVRYLRAEARIAAWEAFERGDVRMARRHFWSTLPYALPLCSSRDRFLVASVLLGGHVAGGLYAAYARFRGRPGPGKQERS